MPSSAPADHAAQRVVLDRIGSLEREHAVLYARQARARAELARVSGDDQGVYAELAGTARVGQAKASGQLSRDERLVGLFPVALGLLELGVMRVGTVQIVLELTKNARPEVQQVLDTRLSERICPMDAVDVRRLVAATLLEVEAELDEAAQRERFEKARANRGVWAFAVQDGMARIGAELDELTARRWALDFDELVRAQKVLDDRDGVVRTQAQRRADVFTLLPSRLLAVADAAAKGRLAELQATVLAMRQQAARDGQVPETSGPAEPLPCPLDREQVLLDVLRLPVRNPVTMYLHTAMTTMLDLDQRSGWLEGFGPVPAMRARFLLPTATLRRVAVDERTGVPLGMDPQVGINPPWRGEVDLPDRHGLRQRPSRRPRQRRGPRPDPAAAPPEQVLRERLLTMLAAPMYLTDRAEPQHDPSSALRAFARLRDQTCDGPGCPRAVSGCELDHETPYSEGGLTAIWNLKHRSTRCHHCKHHGWTVVHDHETGVSDWTSPAGSTFTRESPWQPPTELPEHLQLPEPRLEQPHDLDPDWRYTDEDEADADRPLWREPEPPRPRERRARRRVWNPADGPLPPWHRTGEDPAPEPLPPAHWDDGPPPF